MLPQRFLLIGWPYSCNGASSETEVRGVSLMSGLRSFDYGTGDDDIKLLFELCDSCFNLEEACSNEEATSSDRRGPQLEISLSED